MSLYEPSEHSLARSKKLSKKLAQRRACLSDKDRAIVDTNRERIVIKISTESAQKVTEAAGDQRAMSNLARFGRASGLEVIYFLGSYFKKIEEDDPDVFDRVRKWFNQP